MELASSEIEQISLQMVHMISALISLNLHLVEFSTSGQAILHSIRESTHKKFQCHYICLITYLFHHDVLKDLFT